jgi:hypothetical protein
LSNSIARIGGVEGLLAVSVPNVVLDEELSRITGVDTVRHVVVVVVEDVAGTESEGRTAGVEVLPVVVSISDLKIDVLGAVAVGVADQRSLPVVVEVGVGDSNVLATVSDINETIVVVLVVSSVTGDIDVIDPDIVSLLDTDGVTSISKDLANLQVPDDDVVLLKDTKTDTNERCTSGTENRFVRANFDNSVATDGTGDDHNFGGVVGESASKVCEGRDSDSGATNTTLGPSALSGKANVGNITGRSTFPEVVTLLERRCESEVSSSEEDEWKSELHFEIGWGVDELSRARDLRENCALSELPAEPWPIHVDLYTQVVMYCGECYSRSSRAARVENLKIWRSFGTDREKS